MDLGLRSDWDSVTGSTHAAPRAGLALMLTKDAKTVLKGGAGIYQECRSGLIAIGDHGLDSFESLRRRRNAAPAPVSTRRSRRPPTAGTAS